MSRVLRSHVPKSTLPKSTLPKSTLPQGIVGKKKRLTLQERVAQHLVYLQDQYENGLLAKETARQKRENEIRLRLSKIKRLDIRDRFNNEETISTQVFKLHHKRIARRMFQPAVDEPVVDEHVVDEPAVEQPAVVQHAVCFEQLVWGNSAMQLQQLQQLQQQHEPVLFKPVPQRPSTLPSLKL